MNIALNTSRDRYKLKVLDGLRGGAAIYVMVGHAIWLLATPAGPRADRPWWGWVQVGLAFLFRYGREAVMLFFVLSGVVIHLRLAQSRLRGTPQFDFKLYIRQRVTRIYPPLLASVLFTALVDTVGRAVNPAFYQGVAPQVDMGDMVTQFDNSTRAFAGNLLFLQSWVVPIFGSNTPLWSLGIERFFYGLYPLAFVPIYLRLGPRWAFALGWGVGLAQLVTGLAGNGGVEMSLVYFGMWLAGAAIAEALVSGWQWRGSSLLFGLAVASLPGLMMLYGRLPSAINEIAWGILWALVLLGLLTSPASIIVAPVKRLIEQLSPLAPQSYTLYLFHFPTLLCVSAVYLSIWPSLPAHFGLVAVGIAGCISFTAPLARRLENIGRR